MSIIGPGTIKDSNIRPDPKLQGASQMDVVRIFNPLDDDFAVQVAQSLPVSVQYSVRSTEGKGNLSESDVSRTYGVNLRGPDQNMVSKKHVLNQSVIEAGKSMNFRGDIAQVAVRQLVNEIMQQRGLTRFLHDPVQREKVEEEIILSYGSMDDLMNNNLKSVTQQIDTVIKESNDAEESFPGLREEVKSSAPAVESVDPGTPGTDTEGKAASRGRK